MKLHAEALVNDVHRLAEVHVRFGLARAGGIGLVGQESSRASLSSRLASLPIISNLLVDCCRPDGYTNSADTQSRSTSWIVVSFRACYCHRYPIILTSVVRKIIRISGSSNVNTFPSFAKLVGRGNAHIKPQHPGKLAT